MNNVEIFENERAAGYDQFVATWIPNYHHFLDQLPKLMSETIDKDLLVVGCGTGNEIERFVHAPDRWTITGIDPSIDMIEQAREKFQDNHNVTLIKSNLSELEIEKKYSAATLLLVLHFIDDNGGKLNLLKEIAHRLISGAVLIILDITGDKIQIRQNLKILKSLLPDDLDTSEINNCLYRIENVLHVVSEERLSELCQEAGFEQPLRFFQSSIYMGWMTKKK